MRWGHNLLSGIKKNKTVHFNFNLPGKEKYFVLWHVSEGLRRSILSSWYGRHNAIFPTVLVMGQDKRMLKGPIQVFELIFLVFESNNSLNSVHFLYTWKSECLLE